MNRILAAVVLMLASNLQAQNIESKIEVHLKKGLPEELKKVWSSDGFSSVNRKFVYSNYGEMLFLALSDVQESKLNGEINDSMSESNYLYQRIAKGEITEKEYEVKKRLFFLDPIMTSKLVDKGLKNITTKVKSSLVFAASTWEEGFTYMFYGFDEKNSSGIWIWRRENSMYPVKIADNLSQLFGDLTRLQKGFASMEDINKKLYLLYRDEEIIGSDFIYGIFPPQDLRRVVMSAVPDLVVFAEQVIELVPQGTLNAISASYLKSGISLDFEKNPDLYLHEYLERVNKEHFNPKQSKNFFVINFPMSYKYGVALVTAEQGRVLNQYGLINFGIKKETDKAFEFLNYEGL